MTIQQAITCISIVEIVKRGRRLYSTYSIYVVQADLANSNQHHTIYNCHNCNSIEHLPFECHGADCDTANIQILLLQYSSELAGSDIFRVGQ